MLAADSDMIADTPTISAVHRRARILAGKV